MLTRGTLRRSRRDAGQATGDIDAVVFERQCTGSRAVDCRIRARARGDGVGVRRFLVEERDDDAAERDDQAGCDGLGRRHDAGEERARGPHRLRRSEASHHRYAKADCNGGDGVNLSVADYPEVGNNLNIATFNGGPSFKWLFDNSVIYSNTSTTAGVTLTTHPFKVVLKGTKLVAAVAIGAPAKPGVTLTGTITCPSGPSRGLTSPSGDGAGSGVESEPTPEARRTPRRRPRRGRR